MKLRDAITQGGWSRGRTLLTAQTRRWTQEQWARNELQERALILVGFTQGDEGRGRNRIATVNDEAPEWDANALATSRVPELLDALGGIVATAQMLERSCDCPTCHNINSSAGDRICALLEYDPEAPDAQP